LLSTMLAEFSVINVREFVIQMQERNFPPYTVQGHVDSLKAFDSWLFNEGSVPEKVLARLRKPKVPKKFIEPLTQDEIEQLLKVQNPLTAVGCRDRAILVALLNNGLSLCTNPVTRFPSILPFPKSR
jgi:site-specific recombinase XerD